MHVANSIIASLANDQNNIVIGNSKVVGGRKAKNFEGKYDAYLEYPEGWGGWLQTQ